MAPATIELPGDEQTSPKIRKLAKMHYVAALTDCKKLDSSRDRGKYSSSKSVEQGIRGWDESARQMS